MPASRPDSSTTGRQLVACWIIALAASPTVDSVEMVITGAVIMSFACIASTPSVACPAGARPFVYSISLGEDAITLYSQFPIIGFPDSRPRDLNLHN